MRIPDREQIERLRSQYKKGMRIELIQMDDPQAPPAGTCGSIVAVDDIGNLIIAWDNGCGLNIVPDVDRFRIVTKESDGGD